MLPTYFHIGASKCKSGWLHQVCLRHPDIYVPSANHDNVNFFTTGWHRGLEWYQKTYFAGVTAEKVVGEFSNSYMVFEPALQRLAATVPDARLTMTIMNPVDRVFYQWAHVNLKRKCRITQAGKTVPISRVDLQVKLEGLGLQREPSMIVPLERMLGHHGHSWFRQFADTGFYAFHIQRLQRYFKPHQLKVMLYDDLLTDQPRFLRDYFRFLGVDDSFICTLKPESVNVDPLMAGNETWYPSALRKEFTEVYREDILNLQDLLQRDLSHWLDPDAPAAYRLAPR